MSCHLQTSLDITTWYHLYMAMGHMPYLLGGTWWNYTPSIRLMGPARWAGTGLRYFVHSSYIGVLNIKLYIVIHCVYLSITLQFRTFLWLPGDQINIYNVIHVHLQVGCSSNHVTARDPFTCWLWHCGLQGDSNTPFRSVWQYHTCVIERIRPMLDDFGDPSLWHLIRECTMPLRFQTF